VLVVARYVEEATHRQKAALVIVLRCHAPPLEASTSRRFRTGRPAGLIASRSGTIEVMSTQIAVRLPDELVAYVDQAVAAGRVKSRAELVSRLIARDARRQRAEEDLQRLIDAGALDDADALAMAKATSTTSIED
jgi:Arc/MetJ-type ribon-helix-helix transcriptional regulator